MMILLLDADHGILPINEARLMLTIINNFLLKCKISAKEKSSAALFYNAKE